MSVKLIIAIAAMLLLAGCGNNGNDVSADNGTDNGVDVETPRPDPFDCTTTPYVTRRAYKEGVSPE